jgi:hypothetical protein
MTVKQLIERLSSIEDQEARVVTRGYEGGYNDVADSIPAIVDIALDVNEEWYYGRHEMVGNVDRSSKRQYQIVRAIIL